MSVKEVRARMREGAAMRILMTTIAVALSGSMARAQQGVQAPMPTPSSAATATSATTPSPAAGSSSSQTDSSKSEQGPDGVPAGDAGTAAPSGLAKPEQSASPGESLDTHIKKGSEADVDAVGQRSIGGRGMRNWYSANWEMSAGRQYSMQLEKSSHLVTDPVVVEYVNRIAQNLVKNSDAKVPFTVKVLDTDEINAMALPGGYFYVDSGLILACDSEDELAGVMAHEIAHVAAHHAAREMTKLDYMQLSSIPMIIFAQGSWTGYGVYEVAQLAMPLSFLEFSREYETEADFLGIQYMYRAGYDPQGMVSIFEKLNAMEKHKPGTLSRAFSDHPATPERIAAVEHEIATILPARPEYLVTTSEFDDVKARLERIQNKRGVEHKKGENQPTLRRIGASNNDSQAPGEQGPPILGSKN